jgi:hypothetical protein
MEKLRGCTVNEGEEKGRVRLTLTTAKQEFRAWLDPEQAEDVAAAIIGMRFDLPVIFQQPKRKRSGVQYLTLQSAPKELGSRPHYHEATLRMAEQHVDPEIRSKLTKAQKKWDRRFERKTGRKWGEENYTWGFLKGRGKKQTDQ